MKRCLLSRASGFTLLEVLVALAIVAITMTSALRSSGVIADGSTQLRARLVGLWVARNRLAMNRAFGAWLPPGVLSGEETQGGMKLFWRETISQTANKKFRRVEIKVYLNRKFDYAIAELVGYIHNGKNDATSG